MFAELSTVTNVPRGMLPSLAGILLVVSGCAGGAGTPAEPQPADGSPQLLELAATYRGMGFVAADAPLPFVASLRAVAGPTPDSTLLVLGVSLSNDALQFQRDGSLFTAAYRVEVRLAGAGGEIGVASDETVRVRAYQETQRSDESVIFQRFLAVAPGSYEVTVTVRDRNGPAVTHGSGVIEVPRLGGTTGLAAPLPVYAASPRDSVADTPMLIVNPRAMAAYGVDTLRLYLEGYQLPAGATVELRATEPSGSTVWLDTVRFQGQRSLEARVVDLPPQVLAVGRLELAASLVAGGSAPRVPILVGFGELWVTATFEEMLSLLRYFGYETTLDSLRSAPRAERVARWRQFWEGTDQNRGTPAHEGLDRYFRRLQQANRRFAEPGQAGWLTDRGETYITLGDPDEKVEQRSEFSAGEPQAERWTYHELELTLLFVDETGFGRFRMTPGTRVEYQRALNRVRSRS